MATKAEQQHAETEIANARRRASAKKTPKRSSKSPESRSKAHAGRKATYALEESRGQPSRKSTRKSANRAKPDAARTGREELEQNAPTARYRRARARAK